MSIPTTASPRSYRNLWRDWDFRRGDWRHWKYASSWSHQNNYGTARRVKFYCVVAFPYLLGITFWDLEGKSSLLLFSALSIPPFRTVKLRSRKPTCPACGKEDQKVGQIEDIDYVAFCGGQRPDWETKGLVDRDAISRIRAKVCTNFGISALLYWFMAFSRCIGFQKCSWCSGRGQDHRRQAKNRIRHLSTLRVYQWVKGESDILPCTDPFAMGRCPSQRLVGGPCISSSNGWSDTNICCLQTRKWFTNRSRRSERSISQEWD